MLTMEEKGLGVSNLEKASSALVWEEK